MKNAWDLVLLFVYAGDGFGCARSDDDGRDSSPIGAGGYLRDDGLGEGSGRGGGPHGSHYHVNGWGSGELVPRGSG